MLTRFKNDDGFIYINPDQVFDVRKYDDETTYIWSGGDVNNYVAVNEPLDQVAMRLNDTMRR